MLSFQILLAGILWFLFLAFVFRFGFYNYCMWRSVGQPGVDGTAVYRAKKDSLFSFGWISTSIASAVSIALGLAMLKGHQGGTGITGIEVLGLLCVLAGLGLGAISSLFRMSKVYSDQSRASQ